jgi:AraC-like DNA-binding protein
MLNYLGDGVRCYGKSPVLVNQRSNWEFVGVLRGEISLLLPSADGPPRRRRMWIFPPRHPHGWGGVGTTAEVAVFHFPNVPEPLQQHFRKRDHLEVPLDTAQCRRLRLLARRARCYMTKPSRGILLCHEQILLELSLMALECDHIAQETPNKSLSKPLEKSLHWFSDNMSVVPSLERIAQEAGVSPAHLRRLFHRTFQTSPKQFFDQLRFQRAMQLMADPEVKLESISEQCGFESASAFSRAFRNKFGCSPTTWRVCVGL